jgi:hypothetical protein
VAEEIGEKTGVLPSTFMGMTPEQQQKVLKQYSLLDSEFLPADEYGQVRLKDLSKMDIKEASQAAFMDFATMEWNVLSNQYKMSNPEQRKNTLEAIKTRARLAESYFLRRQTNQTTGQIVKNRLNLLELYGDQLENTPFYDVVREGVLGIKAPRNDDGTLDLGDGESAPVPPAANSPAKNCRRRPCRFYL